MGLLVSVCTCLFTTYGIYRLISIADYLEGLVLIRRTTKFGSSVASQMKNKATLASLIGNLPKNSKKERSLLEDLGRTKKEKEIFKAEEQKKVKSLVQQSKKKNQNRPTEVSNDTIFDSINENSNLQMALNDDDDGPNPLLKQFKGINQYVETLKEEDEEKAHKEFLVKRFQDFPVFIEIKGQKAYETATIFINSSINLVSNLSSITYVVSLSKELVTWDENIIKLVSFLFYMLVVIFVVEPEKLKYLTWITTVLFMGISKKKH